MRSVAFLRGINVGGHRVTKDELVTVFADLGFSNTSTFLASGNVLFDHDGGAQGSLIGAALETALGYSVPTTLRSGDEIRAIAERVPFRADAVAASDGKPQVILLFSTPTADQRRRVLDVADPDDLLAIEGREIHWLPSGGISDSNLDLNAVMKVVGPITVRTANTIVRLMAKL